MLITYCLLLMQLPVVALSSTNTAPDPDSLFLAGQYQAAEMAYRQRMKAAEQSQEDTVYLHAMNRAIECLWRMGDNPNAELLASQLSKRSIELLGEDNLYHGMAMMHLGVIDLLEDDLKASERYFRKALSLYQRAYGPSHPEITNLYYNLGVVKKYNGSFDSAIYYLEKTLAADRLEYGVEDIRLSDHYSGLAAVYTDMGFALKAQQYYDSAVHLHVLHDKADHPYIATTYVNLGINLAKLGKYQEGIAHLFTALEVLKKYYPPGHFSIWGTYDQISSFYYKAGNYDQARKYAYMGLRYADNLSEKPGLSAARHYNLLGAIYQAEAKYDSALLFLKKSEALLQETGNQELMIAIQNNKLISLLGTNQVEAGLQVFETLHATLAPQRNKRFKTLTRINLTVGKHFLEQGEYQKAMKHVDEAIAVNLYRQDGKPQLTEHFIDAYQMIYSLSLKANILAGMGELDHLTEAVDIFGLCSELIGKVRSGLHSSADADQLYRSHSDFYRDAVAVCHRLYEMTGETKYAERALVFSEERKAWELMESYHLSEWKNQFPLPDSLRQRESEIDGMLRYYHGQLVSEGLNQQKDVSEISSVVKQNLQWQQKKQAFDSVLMETHPAYFDIRYRDFKVNPEHLRTQLGEGQVLLEYFTGKNNNFCFVIKHDSVFFLKLPKLTKAEVAKWLNQISIEPDLANLNLLRKTGYEMYQKLFLAVDSLLQPSDKQLVIVPEGLINTIPFDLLVSDTVAADQYLIHRYAISYAHSALMAAGETIQDQRRQPVLAVAPNYNLTQFDSLEIQKYAVLRAGGSALRWNQEEVASISKLVDTRLLVEALATEERFKKEAPYYQILHLAGHAFLDPDNPELSYLAFAANEADSTEGRLNFYELASLNLLADLAVLSACNTASNKQSLGGMPRSLGYSFQLAGVRSVMVSQWAVDDRSTRLLMEKFYIHLKEGLDKSEAIRAAKLDFLKEADPVFTHPFYWAAFVIYGDVSEVDSLTNDFTDSPFLPGLVAVLLIGAFMVARRMG